METHTNKATLSSRSNDGKKVHVSLAAQQYLRNRRWKSSANMQLMIAWLPTTTYVISLSSRITTICWLLAQKSNTCRDMTSRIEFPAVSTRWKPLKSWGCNPKYYGGKAQSPFFRQLTGSCTSRRVSSGLSTQSQSCTTYLADNEHLSVWVIGADLMKEAEVTLNDANHVAVRFGPGKQQALHQHRYLLVCEPPRVHCEGTNQPLRKICERGAGQSRRNTVPCNCRSGQRSPLASPP